METYAFILGRKKLLSIAELYHVLTKQDHIIDIKNETLVASLPEALNNPQQSLNKLGGTTKIAKIFAELPAGQQNFSKEISDYLQNHFKDRTNKVSYAISVYNFAQGNEQILRNLLIQSKNSLKKAGLKCRFINKNFHNPVSAAIAGEKLLEEGAEIIVIQGNHKIFLGHTVAIQDFEDYGERDYKRPARDAKLGMLPPKLAQIMINLGGLTRIQTPSISELQKADRPENKHPHPTVYDPFAGVGTILTEGLLLGYNVVGSDIEPENIERINKNTEWTKNRYFTTYQNARAFTADATQLTKKDIPEQIDLISTESYLGPPRVKLPSHDEIKKNFHYIEELITRFFRQLADILPSADEKEVPIVISFPIYRSPQGSIHMENLIPQLRQLGFHTEPLIPKNVVIKHNLKLDQTRDSQIYDRPDQVVGREIFRFIKS